MSFALGSGDLHLEQLDLVSAPFLPPSITLFVNTVSSSAFIGHIQQIVYSAKGGISREKEGERKGQ